MAKINCCKECEYKEGERPKNCHDKCIKYNAEKLALMDNQYEINKRREIRDIIDDKNRKLAGRRKQR